MELKLYKTMWGYKGDYASVLHAAKLHGFDGIEGPMPRDQAALAAFAAGLAKHGLSFILEIPTTGTYVPDRKLGLQAHLDHLRRDLSMCGELRPVLVTCLGGCDAWPLADSLEFFTRAMELADRYGQHISFETHRGRSLFNPWVTREVVAAIPGIRLTGDFSHWCVVCEGLQDTEETIIRSLLPNISHVHGRVGYEQGPQVPDPFTAAYAAALQQHIRWWQWIWQAHAESQMDCTTMTPEFGPDGYEYRSLDDGRPLVDVEELNLRMAEYLRTRFNGRCHSVH